MAKCRVCNRALKNPKWIELGIGPVCASKQAIAEASDGKQSLLLFDAGSLEEVGLVCERQASGDLATNVPQRFVWHSPTGFEIGYAGSGPADLALNVLAQLVPLGSDGAEGFPIYLGHNVSATAGILHQDFKRDFLQSKRLAPHERSILPIASIRAWLASQQQSEWFKERIAQYKPEPAQKETA
jgi:hypothetical protein